MVNSGQGERKPMSIISEIFHEPLDHMKQSYMRPSGPPAPWGRVGATLHTWPHVPACVCMGFTFSQILTAFLTEQQFSVIK